MSTLTNSPAERTVLELEQAKSFAFFVELVDGNGSPVDLSSAAMKIAIGSYGAHDAPPVLVLEENAAIPTPTTGVALFSLQAAALDLDCGRYPFVIVLRVGGYSQVIVKGELDVQPNIERASTGHEYASTAASSTLEVRLRGRHVIRVVARGAAPADAAGGLSAAGVPAGALPTALGDGTWEWQVVPAPEPVTWDSIDGKPVFGDLATGNYADLGLGGLAHMSYPDLGLGSLAHMEYSDLNLGALAHMGFPDLNLEDSAQMPSSSWLSTLAVENNSMIEFALPGTNSDGKVLSAIVRHLQQQGLGTADLNTIVTAGQYWQGASAQATLARNYPLGLAGALEVMNNGTSMVIQRYTTFTVNTGTGGVYTRTYYNGVWQAWTEVNATSAWTNWSPRSGVFAIYDGSSGAQPQVRMRNGLVEIGGAIKPASAAAVTAVNGTGFSNDNLVATLASTWAPYRSQRVLCPGTGSSSWVLNIEPNGNIYANRASSAVTTASWLPFSHTYYSN